MIILTHMTYFTVSSYIWPDLFLLGPESLKINGQNVIRTRFEPTKKMSTYLVAFIVCEFTYSSKQKHDMDLLVII